MKLFRVEIFNCIALERLDQKTDPYDPSVVKDGKED
jgi:hypothetical protein